MKADRNGGLVKFGYVDLRNPGRNGIWNSGCVCSPPHDLLIASAAAAAGRRQAADRARQRQLRKAPDPLVIPPCRVTSSSFFFPFLFNNFVDIPAPARSL
jgi:hypothetical protein